MMAEARFSRINSISTKQTNKLNVILIFKQIIFLIKSIRLTNADYQNDYFKIIICKIENKSIEK